METYLKNILVVSFGFLLLFTAYGGLQSLQSSLHDQEGLGVASLSVVYGALILSSMFLPPILIKKFGCKWTIVASMCCYITFSLGNFYASWYTLIPTSIILGLGGAPLWSAKCTYLTIAGNAYAQKAGKIGKDVINQYFGIFFLIFQSSGVWGNLISSIVFGQSPDKVGISEADLACCGAYDTYTCKINQTGNDTGSGAPNKPSQTLIYTLLGIYTGSGVLAVLLVTVFLDRITANREESKEEKSPSFCSTFLATFRHLKDVRQCLLIPLTMYSGFEQGFLAGDYTKSYVTCALGINFVGYVMICFSAANSLCSMLFGKISQFTGRRALFVFAAVLNLACIITLLYWKPRQEHFAVFFILAALWGVSDAIWQTQTNVLGLEFPTHIPQPTVNTAVHREQQDLLLRSHQNALQKSIMGCKDKLKTWMPSSRMPVWQILFPASFRSLYGVLFEKHKVAAFANYRLWESLGFVIAFGYSTFLQVYIKLYIVLAVLVVAIILYGIVEYLEPKSFSGTSSTANNKDPVELPQGDHEIKM